jgi:putative Mn2+ efflux pump MntP
MGMYETTTDRFDHDEFETDWADRGDREHQVDWAASCRLALVVSILAAAAALLLSAVVGETALVVTVIVAATAISWFHLEHGQLSRPLANPLSVRRD